MATRHQMSLAVLLLIASFDLPNYVAAKGAGRAFPIESENFAIESFQKVNPNLEWDHTNFLVDLSGHYAHCKAINSPPGIVAVNRLTPQGATIIGAVDYTEGRGSDVNSVNGYIQTIVRKWQSSQIYYNQVKAARVIGCSVRPGCGNHVVVACLFSPGYGVNSPETMRPTPRPTERPTPIRTHPPSTEAPVLNPTDRPEPIWGIPRAVAFTPQQYSEAEQIFGRKWDRSHYMENLSGYETDCGMIGAVDWPFNHMKTAEQPGTRLIGQFGSARNRGSTPDALQEIISKFKPVSNSREIGCSLIADCISPQDKQMYVVISCLFEEMTARRFR